MGQSGEACTGVEEQSGVAVDAVACSIGDLQQLKAKGPHNQVTGSFANPMPIDRILGPNLRNSLPLEVGDGIGATARSSTMWSFQ
jgi:hypothetical protein